MQSKSKHSCPLHRLAFYNITPKEMWKYNAWPAIGAAVIAGACIGALILTDLIFVPGVRGIWYEKLYYSKQPFLLLLGVLVPTCIAWFFAIYLNFQGKLVAKSWPIIAVASWLSLFLNPVIWLFALTTFFVYGFIIYFVLIVAGLVLWGLVLLSNWVICQTQHK